MMVSSTVPASSARFLLNNTTLQDEGSDSDDGDAYEFVAFLLWYLFLVICCVLPTCCAYRRRRLMEARIAQQQANFDHLHQQNVFILSNLHMRPDLDGEEARVERTKRITEALKVTTFTVVESDISEKIEDDDEGDEKKTSIHVDEELGAVLDHDTMDHSLLTLRSDAPNSSRTVPGGCAICLCPYEPGDQVSWSGEDACKHAFHSECIIPWLAKKNEPKCPCCRQTYCVVEPVTSADLGASAPFGFNSMFMGHQTSHIMTEGGMILTPDLTASRVVPESGIVLLQRPSSSHDFVHGGHDQEEGSGNVLEDGGHTGRREDQQFETTGLSLHDETEDSSPAEAESATQESTPDTTTSQAAS